jgi:predicted RecB family nuclease
MNILSEKVRLSATDLSNHLACHHLTTLDLKVARGERKRPEWVDPNTAVIRERGLRHETAYLQHLKEKEKLTVTNLGEIKSEQRVLDETLRLMDAGAEVIVQGALADADWLGRPDVLRKVNQPSAKWPWSYQIVDTKLSRETKAATILQLSTYSELLERIQGTQPEWMWVITPGTNFVGEKYRVAEYAAYFRYLKTRLTNTIQAGGKQNTYPEPVPHCDICHWFKECDSQRRSDDHLSLAAGIRRQQRNQLEEWQTETMAKLAVLPIPLEQKPKHASREGIQRVREQARLQVATRTENQLKWERLLPIVPGIGFCRLPEPSTSDVFLDLEGDAFVGDNGLQYIFGIASKDASGDLQYENRWALNSKEEKQGFEWLVDEIMRRRTQDPHMHVYHFGAYEPATLKRLMAIHATREDEIDGMLRTGVFVDLHQTFKQGVLAGVEEYSLKKIEAFYGFARKTPLDSSRAAIRSVQHRLELGWEDEEISDSDRDIMNGYNRDDCFSTSALRDWLETERAAMIAEGIDVPRFSDREDEVNEEFTERKKRVLILAQELTRDIPPDPSDRNVKQHATWLLAQLLGWHQRDRKPNAWKYFEIRDLEDEDLLDEGDAISGLEWLESCSSRDVESADRYRFPPQETSIRPGKEVHHRHRRVGTVVAFDGVTRIVDIKQTDDAKDFHPTSIFAREPYYKTDAQENALYLLGCWVRDHGIDAVGPWRAARDLLLRKTPRLVAPETLKLSTTEEFSSELARIVNGMDSTSLAIQGPPGSGKTTSAARAIAELVQTRRKIRIGVTALSHEVIRNLLRAILRESSQPIRCLHKTGRKKFEEDGIASTLTDKVALQRITNGLIDVLGGTSWLWSRKEFANCVDVLFVDEASQTSLAEALAISQAAPNIVLIGDPQQLPKPGNASHPDGAGLSALEHVLTEPGRDRLLTMPFSLGLFIEETKRLHPAICSFTSECFYEGRLHPRDLTKYRVLKGHAALDGAGLWFVPVEHSGNRNSSTEEVATIGRIVEGLLRPEVMWHLSATTALPLRTDQRLFWSPYNAQVSDLRAKLRPGVEVGTVDKFQGQQAPIVIYSMTSSSQSEVPHGMEFFYSLNRLNVATSRAMTSVIVVGNPKLFEPDCRTPRQMQLANALCRFRELATEVRL